MGARWRVEETDALVTKQQEDLEAVENAGLTTREHEIMFLEMMVANRDSLYDIASSNNGEDGDSGNDEDTEQGKLSEDDKPGWVMGTISKTLQQHMERFQ
jgi:hypothetical protein